MQNATGNQQSVDPGVARPFTPRAYPINANAVAFGDSQTDNWGGPGGSLPTTYIDRSPFLYANGIGLKGGIKLLANLGIGGSTVALHDGSANPMINRYRDVYAYNVGIIFFQGGINDIQNFSDGDSSPQAIFAAAKIMLDDWISNGLIVFLSNCMPKYSGAINQTFRNDMAAVVQLNSLYREYAANRAACVLVDEFGALVDTTSTTELNARANVLYSDNLHRANVATRLCANVLQSALLARVPHLKIDRRIQSAGDYMQAARKVTLSSASRLNNIVTITGATNMDFVPGTIAALFGSSDTSINGWHQILTMPTISTATFYSPGPDGNLTIGGGAFVSDNQQIQRNPLFLTTAGGTLNNGGNGLNTGTAPANCSFTATGAAITAAVSAAARTVVADGDAFGNNVVMTITNAANGDTLKMSNSLATYAFAPGDKVIFRHGLTVTGMTNVSQILSQISGQLDGVSISSYGLVAASPGSLPYSQADIIDLVVESPPLTIPNFSVVNFFNWQLQVTFNGAGGAVVKVGRFSMHVTSPLHTQSF